MDVQGTTSFVDGLWSESIEGEIERYIEIPALSPAFDPAWKEHGAIARAVEHIRRWCAERPIEGLTVEVVELGERTPVILMEIPAFGGAPSEPTTLLYGHLDKQPEMQGWDDDKGPWKPVRLGDKLYGRGGADDGYAAYASLTAIEVLQRQNIPHPHCLVLIEASEESGSCDLPAHIEALRDRLGDVELVICLDSGCADYERMWCTTSLRGLSAGVLRVDVLDAPQGGGVHSGDAGGVVPSSFKVARQLLARVEDAATGKILLPELQADIPPGRVEQAEAAAALLGGAVEAKFPLLGEPLAQGADAVLARTWRSCVEVVGARIPGLDAGNVLRTSTSLKLSFRLPPTVPWEKATEAIVAAFTTDPPHRAKVSFETEQGANGWNAPALAPWLRESLGKASHTFFGEDVAFMGEGGSIPFMGMLGDLFPEAQFVITGVLGPGSNAHGPNEFLHVPMARKLTSCMASVLADTAARRR